MKNKPLSKWAATLDSRNFFVSVITLIFLAMGYNGLDPNIDAGTLIDAILSGEIAPIVTIFLMNFINPIMKIIRGEVQWSWGFLRSINFWVQATTAVLMLFAGLGIVFPDGAAAALVEAIFGGEFKAIAVAIVINILNPLYHFFFDRGTEGRKRR